MIEMPKIIKSKILATHKDLVKIFMKANELEDVHVQEYKKVFYEGTEDELSFDMLEFIIIPDTDSGMKITLMSARHLGFLNMIHDFILKCGVSIDALEAEPEKARDIIVRQRNDALRKKETDAKFGIMD